MTWREAFHKQAKDDYEVFCGLNNSNGPIHRQLHYLQMATEKLAKAFSCGTGNRRPRTTHAALTRFLMVSRERPDLRKQFGCGESYHTFAAYVGSLIPLAEKIEGLAPTRMDNPNPEYPWEDATGTVIAPMDFEFADICGRRRDMIELKKFVAHLIYNVEP